MPIECAFRLSSRQTWLSLSLKPLSSATINYLLPDPMEPPPRRTGRVGAGDRYRNELLPAILNPQIAISISRRDQPYSTYQRTLIDREKNTRRRQERALDPDVREQIEARRRAWRANQSAQASATITQSQACLLYTSPSPRDGLLSRMPSSA